MKPLLLMIGWFACITYGVNQTAQNESLISVSVPHIIKRALLIFTGPIPKVGILTLIIQIYNFVLMLVFIWSRLQSLDFLYAIFDDPNNAYRYALLLPVFILFPLAWLEIGICRIVQNNKRNKSKRDGISFAASGGQTEPITLAAITSVLNMSDTKASLNNIKRNKEIDWKGIESQCGFSSLRRKLLLNQNDRIIDSVYGELSDHPGVFLIRITYQTDKDASRSLKRLIWSNRSTQPMQAFITGSTLNLIYQTSKNGAGSE